MRLLERDLHSQVPGLDAGGRPERLRIALNADSLATWWASGAGRILRQPHWRTGGELLAELTRHLARSTALISPVK